VHGLHADEAAVFGLDTAGLQAARPELIVVVLSAFGSGGPYDGFAATPNVLLALGGYQFLTGEPGREPLMLPGKQAEYLTGLYGAACALAGVLGLLRQGRGRQFEVTALETLASLHQFTTSMWLYQGIIRSRHGNRWQNLYPITMLPCSNGYMAMFDYDSRYVVTALCDARPPRDDDRSALRYADRPTRSCGCPG